MPTSSNSIIFPSDQSLQPGRLKLSAPGTGSGFRYCREICFRPVSVTAGNSNYTLRYSEESNGPIRLTLCRGSR